MQDINHCEIKFRIQIFDLDACSSFVSQTVVACENRNMLFALSLFYDLVGTSIDIHEHGVWVNKKRRLVQCKHFGKEMSGLQHLKCHLGGLGPDVNMSHLLLEMLQARHFLSHSVHSPLHAAGYFLDPAR
ncbi:hypothetical protein Bca4012_004091 [Brassica carinata]